MTRIAAACGRKRTTRTRAAFAFAATAAVLLASACGTSTTGAPAPIGAAQAARPQAAGTPEPGPTPNCGNPELSLKPPAVLPTSFPDGSLLQRIKAQGYFTAGVDQSTYPFGYVDPADGRLKGFDVDLLREIAKAIFGDANDGRIHFQVLKNADRVPKVADGKVDIVAMTMTVDCLRRQKVDFSDVYFRAGQEVLVQKDPALPAAVKRQGLAGMTGLRVCALDGSTSFTRIKQPPFTGIVPVTGDTWADCLVKLQKGEADGVSTDDTILAGLQAQDPVFTEVIGPPVSQEPYAMAIAKENPDFVRYVNGVLAKLRADGTWKNLYRTYIGNSLNDADPKPPAVTSWRDQP